MEGKNLFSGGKVDGLFLFFQRVHYMELLIVNQRIGFPLILAMLIKAFKKVYMKL